MTTQYVADASIAMSWCFLEEATPATQSLFDDLGKVRLVVPSLWFLDIANVLYLAEKNRRIPNDRVHAFIKFVSNLNIEVDDEGFRRAFGPVLSLCRTYRLTSYDAVYLDISQRRRLALATLDEQLRKAAKKVGLLLLGK
jgi:predicted nucleic acid-binding protein